MSMGNIRLLHEGSKAAVLLYLALRWPWLAVVAFGMSAAVSCLLLAWMYMARKIRPW